MLVFSFVCVCVWMALYVWVGGFVCVGGWLCTCGWVCVCIQVPVFARVSVSGVQMLSKADVRFSISFLIFDFTLAVCLDIDIYNIS